MIRVVVLDFDGVVLESNDVKTRAFRDVFARFPEHLDAMMAYHEANVSSSRFTKFDHLVRERLGRGDDPVLRESLAREFSERTMEQMRRVPFVTGADEFLKEFAERVPLYVASVTPQADLDAIIASRGIGWAFRGVYGCPPWTKAGAVLDVLRTEQCAAGAAVLVGDSPGDLRAAQESGVEFIARNSGITFHPPLRQSFADLRAVADFLRPRLPGLPR